MPSARKSRNLLAFGGDCGPKDGEAELSDPELGIPLVLTSVILAKLARYFAREARFKNEQDCRSFPINRRCAENHADKSSD